jgi:ankyrin repeat protein
MAAAIDKDEVISLLIEIGKADVNWVDDNGTTPVMWAAGMGHNS